MTDAYMRHSASMSYMIWKLQYLVLSKIDVVHVVGWYVTCRVLIAGLCRLTTTDLAGWKTLMIQTGQSYITLTQTFSFRIFSSTSSPQFCIGVDMVSSTMIIVSLLLNSAVVQMYQDGRPTQAMLNSGLSIIADGKHLGMFLWSKGISYLPAHAFLGLTNITVRYTSFHH